MLLVLRMKWAPAYGSLTSVFSLSSPFVSYSTFFLTGDVVFTLTDSLLLFSLGKAAD